MNPSSSRTNRLRLPPLQIRKQPGINQPKKIPLGTTLRLEVPKEVPLGLLLVDIQLGLDVALRIDPLGLGPLREVVDTAAFSTRDCFTARPRAFPP